MVFGNVRMRQMKRAYKTHYTCAGSSAHEPRNHTPVHVRALKIVLDLDETPFTPILFVADHSFGTFRKVGRNLLKSPRSQAALQNSPKLVQAYKHDL